MNRLLKVNGHFYFRMRTPKDLLHIFKVQEIKKSMHTKTLKDAKILAVTYSYKLEKLFLRMRCGMLDEKQIAALVKEFFDKTLNGYEQERAEGYQIPDPEDIEDLESEYISIHHEGCKVAVDEGRKALMMNDLTFIEPEVKELLAEKKLSVDEKSLEFKMLCREILKAFIQVHEVEKDRILGRYDTLNTHATVVSSTAESKKVGVLLSRAIDQFLDEKVSKKEFTSATVADCRSVYKVLLQVVGDVDIATIDKESAIKFREVVSKLPKNMNVIKQFKGKPIDAVIRIVEKKNSKKADTVKLLSDTSRSKYVERVSMLMKWCIESAFYIDRNYFKKLAVKYDEEEQNRRPFSTEELRKLIQSPIYLKKKIPIKDAHDFFIPLIALFTGMRMNEACQLHTKDVKEIDGVWCIDVNKDTSDKTLKSKAARRIVPIHPTLIQAGFVEYVEMMKRAGHERLWIGLEFKKGNYKEAFSQSANAYIDKHITTDKKIVFHSFRNTFINNLKQQDISEALVAGIAGQKHPHITFNTYGEKYNPKPLLYIVMKLEYGVDFSKVRFPF